MTVYSIRRMAISNGEAAITWILMLLQGFLRFKEWNIKEIMRLFKLPESAADGAVNGGMQIGGTLENPSIDFKADFLGGHLGDTPVGQERSISPT